MYRFLPVLIIAILALTLYFHIPLRREVAYLLNLAGNTNSSCCTLEEVQSATGDFDEDADLAFFNNDLIDYPKTSLAYNNTTPQNVLGTTTGTGEEKWIEIILDEQKLRAWEGNKVVIEYSISSGLRWTPTPKGNFEIWYKTRSQKMSGGSKELGNYYYLPNVPHNMFFYKGYAIHGAYWHNNFGNPMSHGCVNEPLDKAAVIFDWAGPNIPEGKNSVRASADNPGTRVYVH